MQDFAIDAKSLKKYPYQLIMTDDYGILNEANLKRYVDGITPKPFKWNITGFDYWQCFSTKNVSIKNHLTEIILPLTRFQLLCKNSLRRLMQLMLEPSRACSIFGV
jgi:hypothetical protein